MVSSAQNTGKPYQPPRRRPRRAHSITTYADDSFAVRKHQQHRDGADLAFRETVPTDRSTQVVPSMLLSKHVDKSAMLSGPAGASGPCINGRAAPTESSSARQTIHVYIDPRLEPTSNSKPHKRVRFLTRAKTFVLGHETSTYDIRREKSQEFTQYLSMETTEYDRLKAEKALEDVKKMKREEHEWRFRHPNLGPNCQRTYGR